MKTLKTTLVAEICLYGTREIGAGYLVRLADGRMIGDGEPVKARTFTHAVWLACDAVRKAGYAKGTVRVFAASGELMADANVAHPGYYGDLKWQPAMAAAERVAAKFGLVQWPEGRLPIKGSVGMDSTGSYTYGHRY